MIEVLPCHRLCPNIAVLPFFCSLSRAGWYSFQAISPPATVRFQLVAHEPCAPTRHLDRWRRKLVGNATGANSLSSCRMRYDEAYIFPNRIVYHAVNCFQRLYSYRSQLHNPPQPSHYSRFRSILRRLHYPKQACLGRFSISSIHRCEKSAHELQGLASVKNPHMNIEFR